MRNPLNRGSSPGRARDWWLRPGSFERGHAKLGGRKKGTRNLISPAHKWAMREAAHRIGSDGNGKDGEYGYFCWVGTSDPDVFYIDILLRLLEWQEYEAAMGVKATACITNDIEGAGRSVRTRKKKPDPGAWLRGGPEAAENLVQDLMRMAVEKPKTFCKYFCAAWLTPPTNWRARAAKMRLSARV